MAKNDVISKMILNLIIIRNFPHKMHGKNLVISSRYSQEFHINCGNHLCNH